jgi:TonB family protein
LQSFIIERIKGMKQRMLLSVFVALLGTVTVWAQAQSDEVPPPDYVPYDKAPEAVKIVQPSYPPMAVQAGVEGTVWVKIWVGRDGLPKKAHVSRSEWPVLNQAAIDAAMRWTFSPATIRKDPVAVWINIPFKFKKSRS